MCTKETDMLFRIKITCFLKQHSWGTLEVHAPVAIGNIQLQNVNAEAGQTPPTPSTAPPQSYDLSTIQFSAI